MATSFFALERRDKQHDEPEIEMKIKRVSAFLGATLNLWKEPLEVPAGQSLLLRYGVAVFDGNIPAEQIESLYKMWLRLLNP